MASSALSELFLKPGEGRGRLAGLIKSTIRALCLDKGTGAALMAMYAAPGTPIACVGIDQFIEEQMDIGKWWQLLVPRFRRIFVDIVLIAVFVVEDAGTIVEFQPAGEYGASFSFRSRTCGMPAEDSFSHTGYGPDREPPALFPGGLTVRF